MPEYAYRYQDVSYSIIVDAERELFGSKLDLREERYEIVKRTPKGFWISLWDGADKSDWRFVLRTARKQYAHETPKDALLSLIARKKRQQRILKAQLQQCGEAEQLARKRLNTLTSHPAQER